MDDYSPPLVTLLTVQKKIHDVNIVYFFIFLQKFIWGLTPIYLFAMIQKIVRYFFRVLLLIGLMAVAGSCGISDENVSFKVISYNIHHCNPPAQQGVIDVDRISSVIIDSGAEIAFLQEVDINVRRSGNINQAELIAEKTGLNHSYFYKAIDFMGGEYGVAILSKYPLSDFIINELTTKDGEEQRIFASAIVHYKNQIKIFLGNTHLDLDPEYRKLQIMQIDSILQKIKIPTIIGGDFNATPESPEMDIMFEKYESSTYTFYPTFPNVNPERTIDYIFGNNSVTFSDHAVPKNIDASDHLPVITTVKISR